MGIFQSYESYLEEEKDSLRSRCNNLRFPGFKQMDEMFLKNKKAIEDAFSRMVDLGTHLASYAGAPKSVGTIMKIAMSPFCDSSLKSAMLELKIEKTVVNTVHSLVKAEMSSIIRQLKLIEDSQLSEADRKIHLKIADDSCYKLLVKFCDDGFYLRKYPLVFAPFLMSFVAVYVPITTANYEITPTRKMRQEYISNIRNLRDTVIYFKRNAVKDRLKYIEQNFHGDELPFISDLYLEGSTVIHIAFTTRPHIFKELYNWYTDRVEATYSEFFESALEALDKMNLEN